MLCAELVEKLNELNCNFNVPNQSSLIERALDALAQPESQGPGPDDVTQLYYKHGGGDGMYGGMGEVNFEEAVEEALARWGRSAKPELQVPGPTDEELSKFATDWWNGFAYAEQGADVATSVIDIIHPWHFVGFLRDGLARHGRPAIEPVPEAHNG
jgi:hypothetical protein